MRAVYLSFLAVVLASVVAGGCAGRKPPAGAGGSGNGGGGGGTGGSVPGGYDAGTWADAPIHVPPSCGNNLRTSDEACDDGNKESGDGCSADCLTVEPGFSCIPDGHPCHRIARCGDGVVVLPELCDDGNPDPGDGCSATCKVELGFKCDGSPSTCSPTTCGDNRIEGAESCEDGNAAPFDGCSADCQSEPDCSGGACASRCGDGIVVGEECDDGNNLDGDGCSASCAREPGFECRQPPLGDKMLVPVIYRDFRAGRPADFQPATTGRATALTGIVEAQLDAENKPVFSGLTGAGVTSQATFSQWYRDVSGINHATISKMALWDNGRGGYVNRYGANGEPWQKTVIAHYCGNPGLEVNGEPCTSINGPTDCQQQTLPMIRCYLEGTTYKGLFLLEEIDGNPLFFPVDDDPFTPAAERSAASITDLYADYWMAEPGAPPHNFHFTSEVRYWFQYDASKTYTLDFTGDDDLWLFINKRLALDLGGIHEPVNGSVTIDATSAARFGLTDGRVYEVAVFQAERQTTASSYRLTLSGFSAAPSECTPICGDGILGIGEECDDGVNAGGYGQCGAGCRLTEYCGDGVVQPDYEDCDDGVNIGQTCPSGCRILIIP